MAYLDMPLMFAYTIVEPVQLLVHLMYVNYLV